MALDPAAIDPRYYDETVYRALQLGEENAFSEIYATYHPQLLRLTNRILVNREDAEEACADVFAKLWATRMNYDFRSAMKTYLVRIAINNAYTMLRDKWSALRAPGDISELQRVRAYPLNSRNVLDELILEQQGIIMRDALLELPESIRTAVVKRKIDGLSTEEYSDLYGITIGSAKTRLHRGINKLREKVYSEVAVDPSARRRVPEQRHNA
jgi:RNA polymerase sigma-70 factor, ECF subfamily